jgi:hypothetical protein
MPPTLDDPGGSAGDDAPQPEESITAPSETGGKRVSKNDDISLVLMTKSEGSWY